jgi:hypothetical protein
MTASAGTDEEAAALNIIQGFKSKQSLYNYLKNDNKTAIELYKGIDGDNCYKYLNYVADLCDVYGGTVPVNNFAYIGTVPNNKYSLPADEILNGKDYIVIVGSSSPNYPTIGVGSKIGRFTMTGGVQFFKDLNHFNPVSFLDRCIVYKGEESICDTLPVMYLGHLAEKQGQGELIKSINRATMFLGFTGAGRVLFTKGTGYLAKVIAAAEIGKLSIDGFMSNEDNRKMIAAWGSEGKWFAENWDKLSISFDVLSTLSLQFLTSFTRNGTFVSNKLRVRGGDEGTRIANELDEVIAVAANKARTLRQAWNNFTNIFKANADEVLEATNRIKDYRVTTNLSGKNCGYIEGAVNGNVVDNKIWLSGPANTQLEPQIFTAIEVEGSAGRSWLRNTDSEYKMLNKLASDLGGTSGAVRTSVTGEIKIISELPYCASCQGIIQQFNEMFPNIKLILVDGAK